MKQKRYPLWMLKLRYSKFFSLFPIGGLMEPVADWKELGIDLDGDVIMAKRRFSKRIDRIVIDVIKSKTFIIINKFSKVKEGK